MPIPFTGRNLGRRCPGYVYIVASDGECKIGKSCNVKSRMQSLGLDYHNVVHTIHSEYSFDLENQLHIVFKHRRISGEWFKLTDDDIRWIVRLGDDLPWGIPDGTKPPPR